MASTQPIVRQVKYISLLPQIVFLAFLILVFYLFDVEDSILYGAVCYLLISLSVRQLIPRHHRKGVKLYKNKEYEKAIIEFNNSYIFFTNHKWIDKYRYIVLLSSSRISYLEMSLLNMAFCYAQLGNGMKSKELYEKALTEYPDSEMAKSALKMLDAANNIIKEN